MLNNDSSDHLNKFKNLKKLLKYFSKHYTSTEAEIAFF